MIQDFYIVLFLPTLQHHVNRRNQKGNQKQTRDEDGTWGCFNLQLWFAFQAFLNINDSLCKPTGDSSKQNAHSEQTQKNIVVFGNKKLLRLYEKNRRGEKFSTRYANTVRQTLVRGMSKGQGQAGFLFLVHRGWAVRSCSSTHTTAGVSWD